jgi:hypothetical protein
VPFFGTLASARIATVGLNPSNREFVDGEGRELADAQRRLPTLRTLGLRTWSEASSAQVREVFQACSDYFSGNPYDRWFRRLDAVIAATRASYYDATACHIDLVPYATLEKWGLLTASERDVLLAASQSAFAQYLRASPVELLVLNGKSVVDAFEALSGTPLDKSEMSDWGLPRGETVVRGMQASGAVESIGGVNLERVVTVVGFNHNIQSSYGVTAAVVRAIADAVAAAWETAAA